MDIVVWSDEVRRTVILVKEGALSPRKPVPLKMNGARRKQHQPVKCHMIPVTLRLAVICYWMYSDVGYSLIGSVDAVKNVQIVERVLSSVVSFTEIQQKLGMLVVVSQQSEMPF